MNILITSRNLIFATAIFLVFIVPLKSQNLPQDYLEAHNQARAAVGVAPLRWDPSLANHALLVAVRRVATCAMHNSGFIYGENIARGDRSMSAAEAVDIWVKEKFDYDYSSNTCAANKVCSHYTQVVWKNSVKLGCGRVTCLSGQTLVICNYDPRGNNIGERPY